jgi:hypothetical protein
LQKHKYESHSPVENFITPSFARKKKDMSSLPPDLKEELERRIREFEEKYEPAIFNRKDSMIPRIKAIDYIVVFATGIATLLYLIVSLIIG